MPKRLKFKLRLKLSPGHWRAKAVQVSVPRLARFHVTHLRASYPLKAFFPAVRPSGSLLRPGWRGLQTAGRCADLTASMYLCWIYMMVAKKVPLRNLYEMPLRRFCWAYREGLRKIRVEIAKESFFSRERCVKVLAI